MCVSEHRDIIIYMIVYIHYYNIQGYNYTHFPPILLAFVGAGGSRTALDRATCRGLEENGAGPSGGGG